MDIETYVITIKPESPFGTPLKGDTIFGQFCWQVAEHPNLLNGGLDKWIDIYDKRPFAVFSSAWPILVEENKYTYVIKRPDLPISLLESILLLGSKTCKDRLSSRKENKAKHWFLVSENLQPKLKWDNFVNDKDLYDRFFNSLTKEEQKILNEFNIQQSHFLYMESQHNKINRITMSTGEEGFDPYIKGDIWYLPGIELAIFVAFDKEACSIEQVQDGLTRIGEWGFGRDASIGLGRFSLGECEKVYWPYINKTLITLAPCVPNLEICQNYFFSPFIRFGRHGAQLAYKGYPFKNPIVMADEGAVFFLKKDIQLDRPYIGRAVKNISKVQPEAVAQGYSIVLPLQI